MSWGTKLMIGMAACMSYIIYLVIRIFLSSNDDLLDKNYYEKGQTYNTEYNAKQRAVDSHLLPEVDVNQSGLTISFQHPAHYKLVCKRASDSKLDKVFEGDTDSNCTVSIPKTQLQKGPWNLHLEYKIAEVSYLVEKEIMMP
ncbi:MAG TPA: FixH family protein [Pedobacter sp.]|jgi:hypothetical protein